MKEIELVSELNDLSRQYTIDKNAIRKKFALSNQKYKIGDILKCDLGVIKVDKITIAGIFNSEKAECVYSGKKLKKSDLKPHKNGDRESFYQSRVEAVL